MRAFKMYAVLYTFIIKWAKEGKPQKSDDWPQTIKNPKEVDIDDNTIIIDNNNEIKPEKQKEIVDDETEINTNTIKKTNSIMLLRM